MATYGNTSMPASPPNVRYPPQASQPAQHNRTGSKSRSFSIRSDNSKKSDKNATAYKIAPETHAEKEAKRLHSKADPTLAMNEAEPAAVATAVGTSLASLRSIVAPKDAFGNLITEPDKTNPTRYRWERPLDTIRSFEAAIDGGYSRKSGYQQSDNESVMLDNRRNSGAGFNNPRFPQDSYYAGRSQQPMSHSSSMFDVRQSGQGRDGSFEQGGYYGNNGYGPGPNGGARKRYSRVANESQLYQYRTPDQNVYPASGNQRSYETVGSGSSADPVGYQTDPTSSDNSSVERMHAATGPWNRQPQQHQPAGDYGNGSNQPAYQPSNLSTGISAPVQNKPNKLTSAPPSSFKPPTPAAEKRKSWITRKFSRRDRD